MCYGQVMGKVSLQSLDMKMLSKPNMNNCEIYTLSTNTDHNYTTVISKWSHAYIKHTDSFGNIYCTNLLHLSIHTLQVTTLSTDGMLKDRYKND